MLLGKEALKKLSECRVAVFGIGGVGSFAAEGLARSGVGKFLLVDSDRICLTNINRQIHATHKTIGKFKVEVMRDRILEINPGAEVEICLEFYLPENAEKILRFSEDYKIDYIIDAIDTVTAKIDLVVRAKNKGIPVICSMGTGNKLDPTRLEITDIYKTSVDPLARVMRKELRERGITSLKVLYSKEQPIKPAVNEDILNENSACPGGDSSISPKKRSIPGSVSFVPPVAGLIIAGEVIRDLTGIQV